MVLIHTTSNLKIKFIKKIIYLKMILYKNMVQYVIFLRIY